MIPFESFVLARMGMRTEPPKGEPIQARLYVRDESDLRGEGPATPEWIGATIARQPEFRSTIIAFFEDLVFGGYPVPQAVDRRVRAAFDETQDLYAAIEEITTAWVLGSSQTR
jgi:hypothetical protein